MTSTSHFVRIVTPPYGGMGILSLLCFLFVRLRISQRRKKLGAWNFACMLTYYPDRSSPLLVKIGSQGVTGAALLSRMNPISSRCWQKSGAHEPCRCHLCLRRSVGIGNCRRQRCLRPHGGISVLLTDLLLLLLWSSLLILALKIYWLEWQCHDNVNQALYIVCEVLQEMVGTMNRVNRGWWVYECRLHFW